MLPKRHLSKPRIVLFLSLFIFVLVCFWFFFFTSEKKQLSWYLDEKEQVSLLVEDIQVQSSQFAVPSYASFTAATINLNESITITRQRLLSLQSFALSNTSLLEEKGLSPADEISALSQQENILNTTYSDYEITATFLLFLDSYDILSYNITSLSSTILLYSETQENQPILYSFYNQKIQLLSKQKEVLQSLSLFLDAYSSDLERIDFSTKNYITQFPSSDTYIAWSVSLEPSSLQQWTNTSLSLLDTDLQQTQEEALRFSTSLYNIDIEPTYQEELLYGFLDQMSSFENPPLYFDVTNKRDSAVTLVFTAKIDGYTSKTSKTVSINPKQTKQVSLYLSTLPSVSLTEKRSVNLQYSISLSDNSSSAFEETVLVSLYPKNVMIWNNNFNVSNMLIAGFVTPHATEVKELLRAAADHHPSGTMSSFCDWCDRSDDWRLEMQKNVKAIYNALKFSYDVTYVNTPIAYGTSDKLLYQTVYLPRETLSSSSANCIDGTVLFASALEAIEIDSYIVLVPEHSFVCYDLTPQDDYDYIEQCLETTMINDNGPNDAIEFGNDEIDRYWDESVIISVKEARELGILPIE